MLRSPEDEQIYFSFIISYLKFLVNCDVAKI